MAPDFARTLWHGTKYPIWFEPIADATALTAFGLFIVFAISWYVVIVPFGIFSKAFQIFIWKFVPFTYKSNFFFSIKILSKKSWAFLSSSIKVAFSQISLNLVKTASLLLSTKPKYETPLFVKAIKASPKGVNPYP